MLNKTFYFIFIFLAFNTTISYAQQESLTFLSSDAQMSLEQRGFKIINTNLDTGNIVVGERPTTTKIQINFTLQGLISLSKAQQESIDIMTEDFEDSFPTEKWQLVGDPTWGVDDYRRYEGNYSVWCAGGGSYGLEPQYNNYPNNYNAMMVYGPFSLKDKTAAEVNFFFWLDTEINYDWFSWVASIDDSSYYGHAISGWSGWDYQIFNLADVPQLGNLTGKDSVWIAFIFSSNEDITDRGCFVDNIKLWKGTAFTFNEEYDALINGQITPSFTRGLGLPFPTFVDIDDDGDHDLFIGGGQGNLNFFRNDGNSIEPSWTYLPGKYNSIDVGGHNAPTFTDIDGDGDYDLFIG